jgi:hypothetical protein
MTIATQIVLGVFVDLIAAPFCYEGCAALMNRQWGRAISAYVVGLPLALIGLSIVGIIPIPTAWVIPIVEPLATDGRWWLFVLLSVLIWIGGPNFVQRIMTAWRKVGFRPRIVFANAALDRNKWDHNLYTHLWFRNEPDGGDAWDVRPRIMWTPKDKMEILFTGNAKWAKTAWNLGALIKEANRVDLPNDGTLRALDLCVRKPDVPDFYALDIESPQKGHFRPDRLLQPGFYDVYVTLSRDDYAAYFRFEVEVQAGSEMPKVRPIAAG